MDDEDKVIAEEEEAPVKWMVTSFFVFSGTSFSPLLHASLVQLPIQVCVRNKEAGRQMRHPFV